MKFELFVGKNKQGICEKKKNKETWKLTKYKNEAQNRIWKEKAENKEIKKNGIEAIKKKRLRKD